jgi:hypothetical protein
VTWRKIRLELGRTPQFVNGSPLRGYELVAPLDGKGCLDEAAWRDEKERATVRRFWEGEGDSMGKLIHTRHRTWAFSYQAGEDDDTPFFRLESHHLVPGEYVAITQENGETLPFKVVSVQRFG